MTHVHLLKPKMGRAITQVEKILSFVQIDTHPKIPPFLKRPDTHEWSHYHVLSLLCCAWSAVLFCCPYVCFRTKSISYFCTSSWILSKNDVKGIKGVFQWILPPCPISGVYADFRGRENQGDYKWSEVFIIKTLSLPTTCTLILIKVEGSLSVYFWIL